MKLISRIALVLLIFVCVLNADDFTPPSGGSSGAATTEAFVVAGSLSAGLSAERLFGCDAQDLVCADPGANGTFAVAFLRTATLAGNPVLAAGECVFSTTGMICEGATADAFESLFTLTDPTADRTFTIPDAPSSGVQALTCGGTDKLSSITAAGLPVCSADVGGAGDITAIGTCTTGDCAIEGGNDMFPFLYEGTPDAFETTFSVTDPTVDRAIVFPNIGGTVVTTGDTSTVTSTMIAPDTIVAADVDETTAYAFSSISNSFVGATYTGPTADPADSGVTRYSNNELGTCWEASPAGTDVCATVDASEIFQFSGITSTGGINLGQNSSVFQFNGNTRQISGEGANGMQCCAVDTNTDTDNSIDAPDSVSGVNNGSSIVLSAGLKSSTGLDGNVKFGKAATIQHLFTLGTDPVLSACGITPTVAGNDISGNITIGTGVTTSCTVTFAKTYTAAPACVVSGDNTAVIYVKTTTATVLTITSSLDMASDQVAYFCTEVQ